MGQGVLGLSASVLERIAREVGTPVFVYHAEAIAEQARALSEALSGVSHRIHYSVKANSSLGVLAVIGHLGLAVDIVSRGELARVLRAGFSPRDIIFSGAGKSAEELVEAVDRGVGLINLESASEFEILCSLARGRGPLEVGIRVNPDVAADTHPYARTGQAGHKFGVPLDQVMDLAQAIVSCDNFRLRSLGVHLGSQITDPEPYRRAVGILGELADDLRGMGVETLTSLDLGGGFGISYGSQPGIDLGRLRDAVVGPVRSRGLTLVVEPGRFLVGNAGCLLTRVLYCKRSGGRNIVIVDAGMNDFLRPSLYGAYHDICRIADGQLTDWEPDGGENSELVDVVGPNCESGDFLGLHRRLPPVAPGSILALLGAGAYGFVMSSNYNSRPRAAEVLVREGRYGIIRRRETLDDLMWGETDSPDWIQL